MRLSALSALSIFALLAPAFAATVIDESSVSVTGNGIFGTYIEEGRTLDATFTFAVNEGYENLLLDFSQFGAGERQVAVRNCPDRVCSVQIQFTPVVQGSGATITFSVQDESGAQDSNLKYAFHIDKQGPRITAIGTESAPNCGLQCALRPGVSTITVTYSDGVAASPGSGINADTIWLLTPTGEQLPADWCNATQCNFTVQAPNNNVPSTYSVLATSSDVMGNAVTGTMQNSFIVDGDAPRLSAVEVRNVNSNRLVPIMTGTFELKLVIEDASRVSVIADIAAFSELQEGQSENWTAMDCRTNGECTLRVTPKEGSYRGVIRYIVSDVAGNTLDNKTDEILVAKTSSEPGDFWHASTVVRPATLDKGTVKFFKKVFTMPLRLTGNDPDAHVAYVAVEQCRVEQDDKSIPLNFDTPTVIGGSTDTPSIQLVARPSTSALDELSGELTVTCRIKINTVKGDTFYERPENETVTGTITLVEYPLIAAKLSELTQRTQQEYEETLQSVNELKSIYSVAATVCGGIAGLSGSAATLSMLQGGIAQTGLPMSQPIRVAADRVEDANKKIRESPIGGPLCYVATCKGAEFLNDAVIYDRLGSTARTISGLTTGSQNTQWLNPYKSIYVAYGSACLPAIVYHREQQLGIQCTYNACVQTQVGKGVPLSACMAQKSNLECRYNYGGLFYMSPGAVLQVLRDNVLTVIKNPIGAFAYINTAVLCKFLPDYPDALCKIPKHVDNLHKAAGVLQSLQAVAQTMRQNAPQDACGLAQDRINTYHSELQSNAECNMNYCTSGNLVRIHGQTFEISRQPPQTSKDGSRTQSQPSSGPITGIPEGLTDEQLQFYLTTGYTLKKVSVDDNDARLQEIERGCLNQGGCASDDTISGYFGENQGVVATKVSDYKTEALTLQLQLDSANERLENMRAARSNPRSTIIGGYREEHRDEIDALAQSDPFRGINLDNEKYQGAAWGYVNSLRLQMQDEGGVRQSDLQEEYDKLSDKLTAGTLTPDQVDETIRRSGFMNLLEQSLQNQAIDQKKQLTDRQKQLQEDLKKVTEQEELNRLRNNTQYALTKAMKVALQWDDIVQTASQFGLNMPKFVRGYGAEIENSALGKATDFEEHFLDSACDGRIRQNQFILGLDPRERIGLTLYGTITRGAEFETGDEDTDQQEWQYVVGGQVLFSPNNKDNYTIQLEGPGGVHELYRGQDSKGFGQSNLLRESLDVQYTQVCIRFDNKAVDELFQTTKSSGQSSCVPLKER